MTQDTRLESTKAFMTPKEVAVVFRVSPRTVTDWARSGKLTAYRTLGGHRRFRVTDIQRCFHQMSPEET